MWTATHLQSIRRRLLHWFQSHARALPWRKNRDPYRIWISEVMLQQTQVAIVISFYQRFLKQFPDLITLAQADEQEVLRAWEGLGYYRRARDLHRSARIMWESGMANLPDDPEHLAALPGFGRYTVNAVLSQAYERRLPILEANSVRVLCRLCAILEDPRQSSVQKTLWQLAESLLPRKSIGAFNQALMELGALVCTPAQPRCPACPLQQICQARQKNYQDQIPCRSKTPNIVSVQEVAVVVQAKGKVLIVQRPARGRWAKMWEFPHHPLEWMESHLSAARRLLTQIGIDAEITGEIATIRHSVTRFRITMVCLQGVFQRGKMVADQYLSAQWVPIEELSAYPLSMPQRALTRRLIDNHIKKDPLAVEPGQFSAACPDPAIDQTVLDGSPATGYDKPDA